MLPFAKPNNTKSTLPNKKAKREEKADRKLSSKALSKEKLKWSNGADLLVSSPALVLVISTKKHELNNLDVL